MILLKNIKFITSQPDVLSCPQTNLPEYAFIGRSNVGKSSLINMLANNKKLAKTSSVPGKTKLINYFMVDDSWYLVDLPGYGYAKISKKEREKLKKIIYEYIQKRENLVCLFVLIDIRHEALNSDLEFMNWLGENLIPFSIVFTKCDKISKKDIDYTIENYLNKMSDNWENLPLHFITSAEKRIGRDAIISYIMSINKKLKETV